MTTTNKIEKEKIEKAKQMYMQYMPVTEIARELDVARTSIQYYVDQRWREEREINRLEILDYMTTAKKVDLQNMTASTIKIIARALDDLAKREEAPTVREAAKVSEILSTLDKITRLDENKPTDIISDKPVTVVEIKERIRLDPFISKEIEYDEKSEETSKDS